MLIDIREDLIEACRQHPSQTPEIIIERALDEFSRAHTYKPPLWKRASNYVQEALGL